MTRRSTRAAPLLGLLLLAAGAVAPARAQRSEPFSPPAAEPRYDRDRTYDLLHVRLDLAVDVAAGTVRGTATNVLALLPSVTGPGRRIELDAAELAIEEVRGLSGEAARLVMERDEEPPAGAPLAFETDEARQTLIVHLGEAAGEPVHAVTVRYSARPRGGLHFVRPDREVPGRPLAAWSQGETERNRFWFPTYDFPDDRATSAVSITLAPPLEATSNGRRLPVIEHPDGRRTFRYRMDRPHSTYLISVVIGRFDLRTARWEDIELEYRVPKGRAAEIERSFSKTPAMMEFFSRETGYRYPYPRYAQNVVPQFIYGGMENITASTLTDRTLHDERAHLDTPSDGLVAHELAHQWFGDLLTCASWSEVWLNEGFATYYTLLWYEHDLGRDEFDLRIGETASGYLKDAARHVRPLVTRLYREQTDLFDSVAYGKGALVLHALRRALGDEAFRQGIRLYVARHADGLVETADLRRAMEEASGRDLSRFFAEHAHRPGHPRLKIAWSWEEGDGLVRISMRQSPQAARAEERAGAAAPAGESAREGKGERLEGLPAGELFRIETEVDLVWPDRRERRPVRLEREAQDLLIPAAERPSAILFDPDRGLLADLEFDRPAGELLFVLSSEPAAIERSDAARALGRSPATDAVLEGLTRALSEDPFRGVRQAAAEALGEQQGKRALDALRAALTAEPDSRVRTAIARALGRFARDAEAGAELKRLLGSDPSYAVRAAAAEGLPATRPERTFEALAAALEQSSHGEVVRGAALGALALLGDARAGDLLTKHTRRGAPDESRPAAISALAKWGRERSGEADRRAVREQLEILARDPDYRPRREAVVALGLLGEPAAGPLLRRIESEEFDGRIRVLAAEAREAIAKAVSAKDTLAGLRREIEELRSGQAGLLRRLETIEERERAVRPPASPAAEEGKGAAGR